MSRWSRDQSSRSDGSDGVAREQQALEARVAEQRIAEPRHQLAPQTARATIVASSKGILAIAWPHTVLSY